MFRVVDYSRVSTEEEKQIDALKIQQEENAEFIQKQENWILVDRYIDEGKSATTTEGRSDFQRLLSDMQLNKFDIILIKIIDRGWRSSHDWKIFERILMTNNIKLFIKSRNSFYDYNNPTDYMATGFEASFAEWSSINQSIKMNNAHQTRMKKGNSVVTNGRIWGYEQKDAQLFIIEEEAKIIRYIFNTYIDGKGFRTIANELDKMGVKNRNGKPFALTTLKRIIKQEKYKGTLICGKRHKDFFTKKYTELPESEWIIHENAVPAIISTEVWEKANEILIKKRKDYGLEDKRKIAGYFNGSYCYSGLIKCGMCGKTYYHQKYTSMKHEVWECALYRTRGTSRNGGCDNIKIQQPDLDNLVKEVIFKFWQNREENISKFVSTLNIILNDKNDSNNKNELTKEKDKLANKKDKLIELYSEDLIDKAEFKTKNDEYSDKLQQIEIKLKEIENKAQIIQSKKERIMGIKLFLNTNLKSKDDITEDMIKEVLEQIIVNPDKSIKIVLKGNHQEEKSLCVPAPVQHRSRDA